MELKLDKEPVLLTETVYDGQAEQGVELEYVLPDYYPDVFKLLKCSLTPRIVSYSVSDNKLFIDGVVYVKILYIGDGSDTINVIDQRTSYSKTVELSSPVKDPRVCIFPSEDYCTARAVSGRKIDIRGAISLKIQVSGLYESEILCGAEGMGVQVCTETASVCDEYLCGGSQYIVRENIETGAGGGISAVISSSCFASVSDTKVIADKVVVKGEANIKALYIIKNSSGDCSAEVMEASVPLSRIIDLNGVTDSHNVYAELSVMDFSLEIKQDDSGENRMFGCDITVDCRVCASKESEIKIVRDLYSTDYDSSFTVTPLRLDGAPRQVAVQYPVKTEIESSDSSIAEIFDVSCDVLGVTAGSSDTGKIKLNARLLCRMTGKTADGRPVVTDKSETVEIETDIPCSEIFSLSPGAYTSGISFGITGDNTAEIRAQININGIACRSDTINVVNEITVNEEKTKQKDNEYALRLYYADDGENVWDIAKRYNTSSAAIIAENELDGDTAAVSGMILIPII